MSSSSLAPQRGLTLRKGRQQLKATSLLSFFAPKPKQASIGEQKAKLLSAIAPLNRGAAATDEDKQEIESMIQALEKANPTKEPLTSPLLNGKWKLLYTTSSEVLGTKKPPLFRPSGPIYQFLDNKTLSARNQETAPFFNSVKAELTPISKNGVAVKFLEFKIFGLIPIKAPPSAVGSLDVTFLDEELRISRGDKGNVFVLTMDDPEGLP